MVQYTDLKTDAAGREAQTIADAAAPALLVIVRARCGIIRAHEVVDPAAIRRVAIAIVAWGDCVMPEGTRYRDRKLF